MVRAAVYARISSDDGTALGVARQVKDCRRLAAEQGWEVAEEYVDNDVSAYSGKRRPEYERMLADIEDGLCDAVIVYHADRLTRRPIELEQFVDILGRAGVSQVRFVAGGEFDVGSGDGLLVLRMMAAVAANESATKSRRITRKNQEKAEAGKPHGGRYRPFGYEADKVTIREDEAAVVRTLVARYLAGESQRSLTAWLIEENVPTVGGAEWKSPTVRGILSSPRIAGLRTYRGEVVGSAEWEAIISVEDHHRVLARLEQAASTRTRTPRSYLLSGMLRCGRCKKPLYSARRTDTRRYVCSAGPDHGGCGRLTVVAPPVEELITEAVLYRLDTPELADVLAGRAAADEQSAALHARLGEDRAQRDELAELYATRNISAREWMAARKPIEARINDTERRLARLTRSDALAGLVGNGAQLRTSWAGLNLTRQVAIVKAILDHAVIKPGVPGARIFDPARVDPIWRL